MAAADRPVEWGVTEIKDVRLAVRVFENGAWVYKYMSEPLIDNVQPVEFKEGVKNDFFDFLKKI